MDHHDKLQRQIKDREKKKVDARQASKKIWFGLGMFGMVGWSVALPTVAGGFLGIWLDSHWAGRYSWTLMLIISGLSLGCYNAWYWMQKERHDPEGKEVEITDDQ